MNTNAQFERDLEQWLQSEAPATAPPGLHAAVVDRARTMRQRPGWGTSSPARWFGRNRGLTLLAAAALLLVGGAMAAGSGLVRLPSLVPPVPAPTFPVAVASPTAGPTISPSPTPRPAAVVAFIRYIYRANPMSETGRVWIVGSDGSGAHELFPDGVSVQSGVAWSPDGTRLIYSESREGGPDKLYLTDASGSAPQLLNPDCGATCSDTEPAFSPDGTRLVFRRNWVIATMDLASGQVTELASTAPDYNERPRWSSDGKQIAFSRQDKFGNGSAVFVVDADGRNLRQLSSAGLPARLPDWSPDGSRIVFTSLVIKYVKVAGTNTQQMTQDVYTVRPDWTDLRRLTKDGSSIGATWTPDGRILFATDCRGNCAASGGLWTMDADGSDAVLLVPGGSGLDASLRGIDAAWQPTP